MHPYRYSHKSHRSRFRIKKIHIFIFLIVFALYAFLSWRYVVSPYNTRWKARYGTISLPKGYSIHGIDISHYQGNINWNALAEATIDEYPITFIMMKGTEGTELTDKHFAINFQQAGIGRYVRGVYHYLTPRAGSGKVQARHYLSQVKLQAGDLPPILDIESIGKLSKEELRTEALAWLDACEKAYGQPPIIYTYYKFKEEYLDGTEFDKYPYWIAHYYVPDMVYNGPWKFWQHTDCGHVKGINGAVDLNIYNGSMYDLQHLCIGSGVSY